MRCTDADLRRAGIDLGSSVARARRTLRRGSLAAAAAVALLLAGCGGSSSVTSGFPPGQGTVIGGNVSMPNGEVAAAPSMLERLAQALVDRVEALVAGNVRPVGAGVEVRLVQIDESNIVDGEIRNGRVVFQGLTDDRGAYSVRLPTATSPETCRFYVEVGFERTLTRAFVYSARVDIDFQSEAAVRLLLEEIRNGATSLCGLTTSGIRGVNEAVRNSEGMVFGETAAAVNNSAQLVAAADPNVQNALAIAVGAPTPGPPATDTVPAPTETTTATAAVPTETAAPPTATHPAGTRTNTRVPTATSGVPTRTATNTPVVTNTVQLPTATNTTAPVNTATATDTAVATTTAAATDTPVPTDTAVVPTGTAQPTNTVGPIATATATFTSVVTVPPTATATATMSAARVDVGVATGTAGATVSVPVTLTTDGSEIAAVSNEIAYDSAVVNVGGTAEAPDCTIDPRLAGTKALHARVSALAGTQRLLRVGIIGAANNAVISSGALYTCRFAIGAGASGSIALLNTPEAAGPQAQVIAVGGSDGRIDVTAPPATLGLSAGTAAPGGLAVVTASLRAEGRTLAAVATDIHFDTAQLSVDDAAGPGCTIAPGVSAVGKEIAVSEIPDAAPGQAVLRVGVIGRDNNSALPAPNGSATLFQCRFVVDPGASGTIVLQHSPEGAAPNAQPVELTGESGSIAIQ